MRDKDKQPYNKKGEKHGYWEVYWSNGKLFYKGCYINNEPCGFWLDMHFAIVGKQAGLDPKDKKYYAR